MLKRRKQNASHNLGVFKNAARAAVQSVSLPSSCYALKRLASSNHDCLELSGQGSQLVLAV